MTPRFASAVATKSSFARQVFRCSEDELRRLPPQWRGFVLHRQDKGLTVGMMLEGIAAGTYIDRYDPQATFDAFQGLQPA